MVAPATGPSAEHAHAGAPHVHIRGVLRPRRDSTAPGAGRWSRTRVRNVVSPQGGTDEFCDSVVGRLHGGGGRLGLGCDGERRLRPGWECRQGCRDGGVGSGGDAHAPSGCRVRAGGVRALARPLATSLRRSPRGSAGLAHPLGPAGPRRPRHRTPGCRGLAEPQLPRGLPGSCPLEDQELGRGHACERAREPAGGRPPAVRPAWPRRPCPPRRRRPSLPGAAPVGLRPRPGDGARSRRCRAAARRGGPERGPRLRPASGPARRFVGPGVLPARGRGRAA